MIFRGQPSTDASIQSYCPILENLVPHVKAILATEVQYVNLTSSMVLVNVVHNAVR